MKSSLSVILPCYNCEDTLEQAVQSLYTQAFNMPFEVICVDDASSDNTRDVIDSLKKKYPNIKNLRHDKNRGGGAARNTGIAKSTGNLIICLDSDNYFASDALSKMLEAYKNTHSDGIAMHKRHYFYRSTLIHHIHTNPVREIGFVDLFNGSGVLLDNFLFTRQAYKRAGGYPEHHGFDTQGFEVRFLSAGNSVSTAKDSLIYHRQGAVNRSYFEKVYESGEFSKNMFFIYEEILPLFSDSVRKEIVNFDIFRRNTLEDNLASFLSASYQKDPKHFFAKPTEKIQDTYWTAWKLYMQHNYAKAIGICEENIKQGTSVKIFTFLLFRCLAGLSGIASVEREMRATEIIASVIPPMRQSIFRGNVARIGLRKIGRILGRFI